MEGSREEKGAESLSVEPRKERRGSYLSTIQETGHRHLNAKKFQEVAHLTSKDAGGAGHCLALSVAEVRNTMYLGLK